MTHDKTRLAIIGAGPIGLEAALCAVHAGFDVRVYEQGRIADNLHKWGHVRLFSPFGLNASLRGREALATRIGEALPDDDALLSGYEFADRYLVPLSRLPELATCIQEGVTVRGVARWHAWKRDLIGSPQRGDDSFRLLLWDGEGERDATADYVFDCSGTYPHHNWIGAGGLPCLGERAALTSCDYEISDVLGTHRAQFAGKRTLVVGSGFSAATAVVSLAELSKDEPGTRVIWLTRTRRARPIERIDDDTLSERAALTRSANELALNQEGVVDWRPGCFVRAIERDGERDQHSVTIEPAANRSATRLDCEHETVERVTVDRIIANVGYRPDRSLYEELQIHECYASQGPMKLAAVLVGETSGDCLNQSSPGAETLCNPEPGFFILGAKSYGRDSRFLIKVGLEQIEQVFSLLPAPKSALRRQGPFAIAPSTGERRPT